MIDALKSYAALASGLTEATAAKAKDVAAALVDQALSVSGRGTDLTGKVTDLADDILATSKENREALTSMIRTEVDRAIGRVGFVREDELAALRRHVQKLDAELAALRHDVGARSQQVSAPVVAAPDADDSVVAASAEASEQDESGEVPAKKSKTYIAE